MFPFEVWKPVRDCCGVPPHVQLLCILTCKQVFSSSSIQVHLPWLRCSFDLVVHRPHSHHPFSLALRRPLRLATSQPRSGLGVWCFSCSHNKTSSRRREKRPQEVVDCAVIIRDCVLLPSFVTTQPPSAILAMSSLRTIIRSGRWCAYCRQPPRISITPSVVRPKEVPLPDQLQDTSKDESLCCFRDCDFISGDCLLSSVDCITLLWLWRAMQ